MRNDIFGEESNAQKQYHGLSVNQILIIVLGSITVIGGLIILFNIEMVTALIAMGIAAILTTAIPIIVVVGIIIYIFLRIKWRRRRYFW